MSLEEQAAGTATSIIATLLAGGGSGDEDRAALYRRAASLAERVARCGPWDALRDVVLVARREALEETTPREVRSAALRLISRVESPGVMEGLLLAARTLGTITPEIGALLKADGAGGLLQMARTMLESRGEPFGEDLRKFAATLDDLTWEQALRRAQHLDLEQVTGLLPLLGALPSSRGRRLGYTLLEHPAPRVRARVLAFLLGIEPQDVFWVELAEWALRHTEPALADIGCAALLRMERPDERLVALALDPHRPAPTGGRLRNQLERLRERLEAGGAAEPLPEANPAGEER